VPAREARFRFGRLPDELERLVRRAGSGSCLGRMNRPGEYNHQRPMAQYAPPISAT
jgi:hypothetical protein